MVINTVAENQICLLRQWGWTSVAGVQGQRATQRRTIPGRETESVNANNVEIFWFFFLSQEMITRQLAA